MNHQLSASLKDLTQKIATELVFAEAGKDLGLLPINCLLGEIDAHLTGNAAPEAVAAGLRPARQWMDAILDSTGTFSRVSLKRLGEWAAWWPEVITACEAQTPPPPVPEEWQDEVLDSLPAAQSAPVAPIASGEQIEPILQLNLEDDRELLNEFINESREHLQNIEQGILVLEDNPGDAETLDSIFRAFHTFKGGSGFLNLTAIQALAHELESLLDMVRQQKLAITPSVIDVILEGQDTLERFVDEIAARLAGRTEPSPIIVPTLKLLGRVRDVVTGETSVATASDAPDASAAAATGDETVRHNAGTASAVKVDTLKLDSLVDLVGEMVIAQSLVVQNPDLSAIRNEQLTRDLAHLGRITRDLQRTAMSLRMVPIGATFRKMNRLVRDITAKVGKQVQLTTAGEETELDRTIVEEIGDPLVHMIRNSIDHGIEKPEVRQERGKPGCGTIFLKAYHKGGNIVIELKDDGNGLDRERILAKGIEKGLVKEGDNLTDAEVFNLILAPGFSTAEKITNLSGRGVGMDVVRRNVEKLHGKLEIQSTLGQGTVFSIHLPLTLAIIDGLLVGVGTHRYIVPTLLVRESFRPTAEMISTIHGRGEMVNVRGRLSPLLRLYSHLGIEPTSTDPKQSIVLVVEAGSNTRCVMVDRLLGKQEVVIKSLGETFRRSRSIAGAAILGDGGVGLILDPQALVNLETAA